MSTEAADVVAPTLDPTWDLPAVPSVEAVRGGPLPPTLVLGKDKEEALHELGRWVRAEGLPDTADSELVKFIHSCDYDLEKAKKCARDFYKGRRDNPELFSGWDTALPNMQSIHDVVLCATLPRKTPENFRIMVTALKTSDTTNYVIADVCKSMLMSMEMLFLTEPTCAGIVVLHDLSKVTFSHFLKVAWSMPRKLQAYMEDGLPVKRETVHLLNCSPFVDNGLKLMRHIGRKEDWDRMRVHRAAGDYSELHKFVPVDCLPSDFGGSLPSLEELHDMTIRRMAAFKDIFRSRGLI